MPIKIIFQVNTLRIRYKATINYDLSRKQKSQLKFANNAPPLRWPGKSCNKLETHPKSELYQKRSNNTRSKFMGKRGHFKCLITASTHTADNDQRRIFGKQRTPVRRFHPEFVGSGSHFRNSF